MVRFSKIEMCYFKSGGGNNRMKESGFMIQVDGSRPRASGPGQQDSKQSV